MQLSKYVLACSAAALLAGCGGDTSRSYSSADSDSTAYSTEANGIAKYSLVHEASAELKPLADYETRGQVTFKTNTDENTVEVKVEISGLEPGKHGMHIHAVPNCGQDGDNAGGHFRPGKENHGAPTSASHHVGDLGNVTADKNGVVDTTLSFDHLRFSGPHNILNRPVIVHAKADNYDAQPSGAAGDRVACGIIRGDREVTANPSA